MSVPRTVHLPPGVRPGRMRWPGEPPADELAVLHAGPGPGPAGSPAVLVPGFTGSKEDFLPVLPLLAAAGRRVVAVDLPGQYESPGGDDPDGYRLPRLAVAVAAVGRQLAGGQPVHLVGHSFGGLVCRTVALSGQLPLASLTLLGSGPAGITGERAGLLRFLGPVLDAGGLPAVWEASRHLDQAEGLVSPSPEVAEFLRRRFFASHPVGLAVMAEELLGAPDDVDRLSATGLPVLVAHGSDDDAWSPAEQREMARRLQAEYGSLPGAGHSPTVDRPAATAALLSGFWARVDPGPD
jgi:pimeloyl-ACP methyl ester carboxylesterase